jgi:hypothetical protein
VVEGEDVCSCGFGVTGRQGRACGHGLPRDTPGAGAGRTS